MFMYLFAAGLLAENSHNQSSEGLYFFGYLLCGLAFLMSVGCYIMVYKHVRLTTYVSRNLSIRRY